LEFYLTNLEIGGLGFHVQSLEVVGSRKSELLPLCFVTHLQGNVRIGLQYIFVVKERAVTK
jgi:hypothetical protein